MPGIDGNRPKWPPTRRPVLATRAPLAQARGQAGKGPKSSKSGACCRQAPSNAANPPDRSGSRSSVASLRRRRIITSRWLAAAVRVIAARGGEIHYGLTAVLRWRGARSRHIRRTEDAGRSRQGRGEERRGCEGLTTRPAEACAARKSQAAEVAGPRARRGERIFRKRRCLPRYRQRRKAVASSAEGNPTSLAGGIGALFARFWFFCRRRQ